MILRPGPGWQHIAGPMWVHESGARIHLAGFIFLPNGRRKYLHDHCGGALGRRLIEINDSKRRGLMAWALTELEQAS